MSKEKARRGETPPYAEDMATQWANRGYRPPPKDARRTQVEDPTGEEAYQRAFAEFAKMKPARVPNATWYGNSPSAAEYVRKHDRSLLAPKDPPTEADQRQRNPNFVPISKDLHRASRTTVSPAESASRSQPMATPASRAPGSAAAGGAVANQGDQGRAAMPRTSETGQYLADSRQYPAQGPGPGLPMTLEPSFGPTGPGRMLR